MQLTRYTDYSLRVLMYCARKGEERSTIQEIAEFHGISQNHLVKVAHQLGRLGYLKTIRGSGGGLLIARSPYKISVGKVVREVESNFDLVECFNKETDQCRITLECNLKDVIARAQRSFLECLDKVTLAEVAGLIDPKLAHKRG